MNTYPKITGVTFSPLMLRGYEHYAKSSDGRIWYHTGKKWVKVAHRLDEDGHKVVTLNRREGSGSRVMRLDALLKIDGV